MMFVWRVHHPMPSVAELVHPPPGTPPPPPHVHIAVLVPCAMYRHVCVRDIPRGASSTRAMSLWSPPSLCVCPTGMSCPRPPSHARFVWCLLSAPLPRRPPPHSYPLYPRSLHFLFLCAMYLRWCAPHFRLLLLEYGWHLGAFVLCCVSTLVYCPHHLATPL